MSSFKTPLRIELLDLPIEEKPFVLLEPFEFYSLRYLPGYEKMIRVPAGYRTDFASIPRFFWRILPPLGRHGKAAVIHDWLCDEQPHSCDHIAAAEVFDEAMRVLEVTQWKRRVMVWAVKHFGPKFKAGDK